MSAIYNPYADAEKGNDLVWPPKHLKDEWQDTLINRWFVGENQTGIERTTFARAIGRNPAAIADYISVPVGATMAEIQSLLLFGRSPLYKPADDGDVDALDNIVNVNQLGSRLLVEAEAASVDGERYARIYIDPDTPNGRKSPLVSWHGKNEMIPVWKNGELLACSYVQTFQTSKNEWYRLVEVHEPGTIAYKLFHAKSEKHWGQPVELDKVIDPKTGWAPGAGLEEFIETGSDQLWIIHFPNNAKTKSDLTGLKPLLLAINETYSAGHETAQKAVPITLADERLLDKSGRLDALMRIIKVKVRDAGDNQPFFEHKQFDINSEQFKGWAETLLRTALWTLGIDPSTLGLNPEGGEESGKAMGLRNLRSLLKTDGKAQLWNERLSVLLTLLAQADEAQRPGSWKNAAEGIAVELQDGFPESKEDRIERVLNLWREGLISLDQAMIEIYPDASDEWRETELEKINAAQANAGAAADSQFRSILDAAVATPVEDGE